MYTMKHNIKLIIIIHKKKKYLINMMTLSLFGVRINCLKVLEKEQNLKNVFKYYKIREKQSHLFL